MSESKHNCSNISSTASFSSNSHLSKDEIGYREEKISQFTQALSVVNNICEPLCGYLKFQDQLDPRIRALLITNGAFLAASGTKALAKSALDIQFQAIRDPPAKLVEAYEKTRSDIDKTSTSIEASLREVLTVIQSQVIPLPPCSASPTPTTPVTNSVPAPAASSCAHK